MVMKKRAALVLAIVLFGFGSRGWAQTVPALADIKSQQELTAAITELDKEVFDSYNTCNLDKLGTMVTDDLEFYHDKTGLAVGRQVFLNAIKNNICRKVARRL